MKSRMKDEFNEWFKDEYRMNEWMDGLKMNIE